MRNLTMIKYEIQQEVKCDDIFVTFEDANKMIFTYSFKINDILDGIKVKSYNVIKNSEYNDLYNLCKHCDDYQEFYNMSKDKINSTTVNAYDEQCDLWYQQSILLHNTIKK